MPYIAPEVITEAKRMDLLTYLREYEPGELVKFSSNTYTTRTHDSLKTVSYTHLFYTPPEVSTAIYKVLEQMGFQEGNLLEPSCGIGNFIGMLPKSMENAKVYGVELDTISAGIAQQLYQKSSIAAQGFEAVSYTHLDVYKSQGLPLFRYRLHRMVCG